MIIAITGISSGLGKALVPRLQDAPEIERIIGIDITNYNGNHHKIQFYREDIRIFDIINKILKQADILIHFAFIVSPNKKYSIKEIYDINIKGSINVFRASANNNIKKIIYISSQSVYGYLPNVPEFVSEEAPLLGIKNKSFYYAYSKAVIEKYLINFEKSRNIIITRFRPPIITGKHFINNLLIIKNLTTFRIIPQGNKQSLLQLIHEDDLIDAIILAIKKDFPSIYNIASNIIDFNEYIRSKYDINAKILVPRFILNLMIFFGNFFNSIKIYSSWLKAIIYNSKLDTTKIRKYLGWVPKYSNQDCIDQAFKTDKTN